MHRVNFKESDNLKATHRVKIQGGGSGCSGCQCQPREALVTNITSKKKPQKRRKRRKKYAVRIASLTNNAAAAATILSLR